MELSLYCRTSVLNIGAWPISGQGPEARNQAIVPDLIALRLISGDVRLLGL